MRTEKKYVFFILYELERERYPGPIDHNLRNHILRQRSYEHWAIQEIRRCLEDHMDQNAIDTVEWFRHKIDNYSCNVQNKEKKYMFSVLYDVATDVLDVLLSYSYFLAEMEDVGDIEEE